MPQSTRTPQMSAREVRTLMEALNADDTDRRCHAVAWLAHLVEGCPDALVHALGYESVDDALSEEYLSREDFNAWADRATPRNREERRLLERHGS